MAVSDAADYKPIKATPVRRVLVRLADRLRLCGLGSEDWKSKLPICRKFMIKHGKNNLAEAHTMQFIAENTSIPVPKIFCAFTRKGVDVILMQRMPGTMLADGWWLRSDDSKRRILQQLKDMIAQLRKISPQMPTGVANVAGGPVFDCRLQAHNRHNLHGPFANVQEFHCYLRNGYNGEHPEATEHNRLVEMHEGDWPICFTHGDLSSLNILAKDDRITGIVDWETAGWYPAYWEYATAWNVNVYNVFWREHVKDFLVPMPRELEMEKLRNGLYGYDMFFVEDESYKRFNTISSP